jgi:two-component system, OmpR family, response regulator ResD
MKQSLAGFAPILVLTAREPRKFARKLSGISPANQEVMPKKILLVEDNPGIRTNLASFLRAADYEVDEASNGKSAIELLQKKKVDLVLSDIVMPELSGFSLLQHVRSARPEIPVILMSGFLFNREQILKQGAAGFITKPIMLSDLLSKLELVLKERRIQKFGEYRQAAT